VVTSCDPQALNNAVRCYVSCIPSNYRKLINVSLLAAQTGNGSLTPNQLLLNAGGFQLFNGSNGLAAEVYLLSLIAMGSTDPNVLSNQARCIECIDDSVLQELHTYLLAQATNSAIDTPTLIKGAQPYMQLWGAEWYVELYLYAQLAVLQGALSVAGSTAQSIANASRCFFSCGTGPSLSAIRAFLLCQISLNGGFNTNPNLVPPGSVYPPGAGNSQFNVNILAGMCYNICWGTNDASATLVVSGQTFTSTGAGTCTAIYSSVDTVLELFGAAGTMVTATVINCSCGICVPPPTQLHLQTQADGMTVAVTWDVPPAGVTATEVWTSTDNITFALLTTVAAPGATANATAQAIGSFLYVKLRWDKTAIQGPFCAVNYMSGRVSDWAKRVVANGGGLPSARIQDAFGTSEFDLTLVNNSLDSLMVILNTVCPGDVPTASTPLYKLQGLDPWTNNNFVNADVTLNGIIGDGATKYLDLGTINTGLNGMGNNSAGMTLYFATGNNNVESEFGDFNAFTNEAWNLQNQSGTSYYECYGFLGNDFVSAANSNWAGFLSGSRIAANDIRLYKANSTTAFVQIASNTNARTNSGGQFRTIFMAVWDSNGGAPINFSTKRLSFGALHPGLTSGQTQTLFNAVQRLRQRYGGGSV